MVADIVFFYYNKFMLILNLLNWWYFEGLRKFIGRLGMNLVKITDFFSIGLLVKTLFTPFRLIDSYAVNDDSLDGKIRAAIDKMIGRMIGGLIRTTVLIFGIVVILTTIIWSGVKIVMWLLAPILPIIGAILYAMGFKLW